MRQAEDAKTILTRSWLFKAEQDLRTAAKLHSSGRTVYYAPACFHAQQAAEKFLKAWLTWHQLEFRKTHDVGLLLDLMATRNPKLANLLRGASVLTPYGTEIRYPGESLEPRRDETGAAVKLARKVRKEILKVLVLKIEDEE